MYPYCAHFRGWPVADAAAAAGGNDNIFMMSLVYVNAQCLTDFPRAFFYLRAVKTSHDVVTGKDKRLCRL